MNASFPYVSPAVGLPSPCTRRVVDAGYYDNYGISLAVALLSDVDIKNWVNKNTSGVLILELRSSPVYLSGETYCVESAPESGSLPLEWLTNPIRAALSSRTGSMTFRNQQEIRTLTQFYGAHKSSDSNGGREEISVPIKVATFVNAAKVSLSWYLPNSELEEMRQCLTNLWKANGDDLVEFWSNR
jgi:hypothetical protein